MDSDDKSLVLVLSVLFTAIALILTMLVFRKTGNDRMRHLYREKEWVACIARFTPQQCTDAIAGSTTYKDRL